MSLKTFSVNLQPVQIHRQLHLHQQGIHLEASTFEHTLSSNLSPDFLFTAPSHLASAVSPSLHSQAKLLRLISLFLTPAIQPVLRYDALALSLRSAMDRFDATLLSAFDVADGKGDEAVMKEAAESSWELWDGVGDWEMGKVWAEKREIFYQHGWKPLDNITCVDIGTTLLFVQLFFRKDGLDFTSMDEFMAQILDAIHEHGSRAVRIFPPPAQVLVSFADRLANDVVRHIFCHTMYY